MTNTPPLHPVEREQLRNESTLVVTVQSTGEFHDTVQRSIQALEDGDTVESSPTIAFESYDEIMEMFTPRVLELIEAIRQEQPESINAAARVVDRDVKNVYEECSRLAQIGAIYYEEHGQSKRPVVWFDELVISLPFEPTGGDAATVSS